MIHRFNDILDSISEFLAHRKGLLPMLGVLLVIINGIVQYFPGQGWMVEGNLLLHVGVVLAVLGILLAWAL
jgi:hypothetical protein